MFNKQKSAERQKGSATLLGPVQRAKQLLEFYHGTLQEQQYQEAYSQEFASLERLWTGLDKWEMYKRQIVGAVRVAVQAGRSVYNVFCFFIISSYV